MKMTLIVTETSKHKKETFMVDVNTMLGVLTLSNRLILHVSTFYLFIYSHNNNNNMSKINND